MPRSTTSTISCVRRAATSISASAPRPPTCPVVQRCSRAAGSRSATRPASSCFERCRLVVTTRFPRDAAMRLAREPDFDDWCDRVEVFGLDLRHTPSVEAFCEHLSATHGHLDYIVNNACQTVRRPPEFYRHMLELETASASVIPRAGAPVARRLQRCASSRAAPVRSAPRHDVRGRGDRSDRARLRGRAHALGRDVAAAPPRRRRRRTTSACSPKVASIRTCSRSISGAGTRGGCCSTRCRRWSCSRRSS